MRDMYVTELRTHLLSGLFQENPDDLEVYGEVLSNKVRIVVVNSSENLQFSRSVSMDDFSQYQDRKVAGAGHKDDVQDFKADPALKIADEGSVVEDNPLMPRLQLTRQVPEDEFLNKVDMNSLRKDVSDKVAALSKDFVKEFLKVKTDRAMRR